MARTRTPAGRSPAEVVSPLEGGTTANRDELRFAIGQIARIHGVPGDLWPIPGRVRRIGEAFTYHGSLDVTPQGRLVSLSVDPRGDHPRLTAVHEFGHLLDLAVFGEPNRFGSGSGALLAEWRIAASASQAVARLQAVAEDGPFATDRLFAVEYLKTEEVFARSYAQYVATTSGSDVLVKQLARLAAPGKSLVHRLRVWETDDFTEIASAFDRLLIGRGWVE